MTHTRTHTHAHTHLHTDTHTHNTNGRASQDKALSFVKRTYSVTYSQLDKAYLKTTIEIVFNISYIMIEPTVYLHPN
jgi:hypothetical protein